MDGFGVGVCQLDLPSLCPQLYEGRDGGRGKKSRGDWVVLPAWGSPSEGILSPHPGLTSQEATSAPGRGRWARVPLENISAFTRRRLVLSLGRSPGVHSLPL